MIVEGLIRFDLIQCLCTGMGIYLKMANKISSDIGKQLSLSHTHGGKGKNNIWY